MSTADIARGVQPRQRCFLLRANEIRRDRDDAVLQATRLDFRNRKICCGPRCLHPSSRRLLRCVTKSLTICSPLCLQQGSSGHGLADRTINIAHSFALPHLLDQLGCGVPRHADAVLQQWPVGSTDNAAAVVLLLQTMSNLLPKLLSSYTRSLDNTYAWFWICGLRGRHLMFTLHRVEYSAHLL